MNRRRLLQLTTWAALGGVVGCARAEAPAALEERPTRSRPAPSGQRRRRSTESERAPVAGPQPDREEADPAPEPEPEPEPEPDPPAAAEPDPEPEPEEPEPDPEPGPSPAVRVEVVCRDALGLAAAAAGGRGHSVRTLTVHHTGVALGSNREAPARLRGHQRHHQNQGWTDIAYHYAVDLAGNSYELRDVGLAGDTFTDYDPAGHFLVVCEGNFDQQQPTDALLSGVAELLAWGAVRFGVSPDTVAGHRDHASTRCPGDHLQARLGALRKEAARIAAAGVELVTVCGAEGARRVATIEG